MPVKSNKKNSDDLLKDYYNSTLEALEYTHYSYRAGFKSLLPYFISQHLYGSKNTTAFRIAIYLNLIGMESEIQFLIELLKQENSNSEEKLENTIKALYETFEKLSENNLDENQQDSLKKFKKLIHQFDREIHPSNEQTNDDNSICRIFNLNKLQQKTNDRINKLEEDLEEYQNDRIKILEIENEISNQKKILQDIEERRKDNKERKYAYIKDLRVEHVLSEQKKAFRRQFKKKLKVTATLISIVVGLGEGFVAAFLVGSAAPALIPFLIIGGFCCNYYLFRQDTYSILKNLFYGQVFKKTDGSPLSKKEKALVIVSVILSLGAACAFFFLSLGSSMTLLAAIGLASNPIGLGILAGLIAGLTALALFAIFTHMSLHWIRNGGPSKLKYKILHLKQDIINFWKSDNWAQQSKIEKLAHIAKKVMTLLFNLSCLALSIGIIVLINVTTAGLFHHQSVAIFHNVFHLCYTLSNMLSYILVLGLGTAINTFFYSKGVLSITNCLKNTIINSVHPLRTYREIQTHWNTIKNNPIRLINQATTLFKRLFLIACVTMNAYGQGNGARDPLSLKWIHALTHLSQSFERYLNTVLVALGSFGPNAIACMASTQLPSHLNTKDKKKHTHYKMIQKANNTSGANAPKAFKISLFKLFSEIYTTRIPRIFLNPVNPNANQNGFFKQNREKAFKRKENKKANMPTTALVLN